MFSPQTPPEPLIKYLKRIREDMADYIDQLDDRIRELEKEVE